MAPSIVLYKSRMIKKGINIYDNVVIKFYVIWNKDVLTNIEGVWQIIYENLLPPDAPFLTFPHGGRDCFYVNLS